MLSIAIELEFDDRSDSQLMCRSVFDAGVCCRRGLAVSECCETVGT